MLIPWWAFILIIIGLMIAGNRLQRRLEDLESRVEELEGKSGDKDTGDEFED